MTYLPRVQANSSRHADFRAAIDETGDRGRNRARDVSSGRFAAQRRLAADAYFALIVVFAQRYQKDAGVGTVVAMMLPYGVRDLGRFVAAPYQELRIPDSGHWVQNEAIEEVNCALLEFLSN